MNASVGHLGDGNCRQESSAVTEDFVTNDVEERKMSGAAAGHLCSWTYMLHSSEPGI